MPDVTAPPRPALVVIPGIPLVEVGEEWPASTGPWTVTPDDIAAAVAAQDDPAVRSPIIRLGHVRAGQPAFGRFENLRATNNGNTLVGDLVGAPAWMADLLPYAFPSRSVEATTGFTTATGNTWACVINAVALLGVELPAMSTLDEVAAVYTAETMEQAGVTLTASVAAARGGAMPPVQIAAALTTEDIRRAYYDDLGPGQQWWWIREMQLDPLALIVDDDEGGLWRVPVTVSGESVSFGQPEAVRVEYVPQPAGDAAVAASSAGSANRRAIVYADRAESRGGLDMPDLASVRQQLGLAADVPDEDVVRQAISQGVALPPGEYTLNGPITISGDGGTTDSTGAGGAAGTAGAGATTSPATPATAPPVPVAASTAQVPPGFTLISDAVLSDLNARADQGVTANGILAAQAEDAYIARHRNRIGASTNPHARLAEDSLRARWRSNPTEAETFAASLPVVVHATAPGHEHPGEEGDPSVTPWTPQELAAFPELRGAK